MTVYAEAPALRAAVSPNRAQAKESGSDSGATASVTKALRLLDVFRSEGPVLGVSELARRAGIAKSTAFRLLALLEEAELVEREGRGYRLSWRMFELGTSVAGPWPSGLRDIASPWLTELYVKTGLVSHLAVLDGREVLVLERISGPRSPRTGTAVGSRLPAHCTSVGKAILAFSQPDALRQALSGPLVRATAYSIAEPGRLRSELERVRTTGVAHDREEAMLGLVGVAAPIIMGPNVMAAVAVTGPASRFDWAANETLVRQTARQIAIELGVNAAAATAGL